MAKIIEDTEHPRIRNRRDHMANERNFLAWMRTGVAVMAFGFVVEKFALFIRQLSSLVEKPAPSVPHIIQTLHGYSSVVGIFLVGLGALMGALAFIRYKKVERQIDQDIYESSLILDALLTMSALAVGVFLVLYLIHTA